VIGLRALLAVAGPDRLIVPFLCCAGQNTESPASSFKTASYARPVRGPDENTPSSTPRFVAGNPPGLTSVTEELTVASAMNPAAHWFPVKSGVIMNVADGGSVCPRGLEFVAAPSAWINSLCPAAVGANPEDVSIIVADVTAEWLVAPSSAGVAIKGVVIVLPAPGPWLDPKPPLVSIIESNTLNTLIVPPVLAPV
jgi:hypothetical protein